MYRLLSAFLVCGLVAGDLSPQCFNETQGINDDADFAAENAKLASTIQSIDQATFCQIDSNSVSNTIICNIYYNSDIPNEIEEKCTAVSDCLDRDHRC